MWWKVLQWILIAVAVDGILIHRKHTGRENSVMERCQAGWRMGQAKMIKQCSEPASGPDDPETDCLNTDDSDDAKEVFCA